MKLNNAQQIVEKIFSWILIYFIFRLFNLSLHLLPDFLLHQNTKISVTSPVRSLALFTTVPRLKHVLFANICFEPRGVCYLPTACTLVVPQQRHINMAEPADIVCIVIDAAADVSLSIKVTFFATAAVTTTLSCNFAASHFSSLLQNFLKLFPLFLIRALPVNKNGVLRPKALGRRSAPSNCHNADAVVRYVLDHIGT